MCVCVCVCAHARVCAYVCVCTHRRESEQTTLLMTQRGDQIARRVIHRDTHGAFAAWCVHVDSRADAHNTLQRLAWRLRTEQMAAAFVQWEQACEGMRAARQHEEQLQKRDAARRASAEARAADEASRAAHQAAHEAEASRLLQHVAERTDEVSRLEATLAEQEATWRAKESEWLAARDEMEGAAASTAAAEHAARCELVRRQVARRMLCRDLGRGFTAWTERAQAKAYAVISTHTHALSPVVALLCELHFEFIVCCHRYAMQRLREAANRLSRPGLADAYYTWVGGWEEAKHAAAMVIKEARVSELLGMLDTSRAEVQKLRVSHHKAFPCLLPPCYLCLHASCTLLDQHPAPPSSELSNPHLFAFVFPTEIA